jgi:hypothetical protein
MDLAALKGKPLDEKTHADLVAYVDGLKTAGADAEAKLRKAGTEHAAALKAVKTERDGAFERLGVTTAEELAALPDAKGQAEAAAQVAAKLKKLEREVAEKTQTVADLTGKYTAERRDRAIAAAVGKQNFVDPEDAAALLGRSVVIEGEDFFSKTGDGKLVKLEDAAAGLAKTKPYMVKPSGTGGTGSGYGGKSGGQGQQQMTRAEFDALPHPERAKAIKDGVALV